MKADRRHNNHIMFLLLLFLASCISLGFSQSPELKVNGSAPVLFQVTFDYTLVSSSLGYANLLNSPDNTSRTVFSDYLSGSTRTYGCQVQIQSTTQTFIGQFPGVNKTHRFQVVRWSSPCVHVNPPATNTCALQFTSDGLQVTVESKVVWSTETQKKNVSSAIMSDENTLLLRDLRNNTVWSSQNVSSSNPCFNLSLHYVPSSVGVLYSASHFLLTSLIILLAL